MATGSNREATDDGAAIRAQLDRQNEISKERIQSVETAFAQATQDMAIIVRQIAKLRNAGDQFVANIARYAEAELPSMQENVQAVCECLAAVEDHRQAHVSRIETQVIHPLTQYEKTCKLAKDGLKHRRAARESEVRKQKAYDKVRRDNPNDSRKLAQAVEEMQSVRAAAAQVAKKAEEYMTTYELQKVKDVKTILGDYLMSAMTFHAKSLELSTLAFQNLKDIHEDTFLDELHHTLHQKPVANVLTGRNATALEHAEGGDRRARLASGGGSASYEEDDQAHRNERPEYGEEDDEEAYNDGDYAEEDSEVDNGDIQ